MSSTLPFEYLRLARIFRALTEDYLERKKTDENAQTWFDTRLFDSFLPNDLTVIGQTKSSQAQNSHRRREHLIPRLVVAERCIKMFEAGSTLEEVAQFLRQFLKIVWVSSAEASQIDAPALGQKKQMPREAGDWWENPNSIFTRLERAKITRDEILPDRQLH